MNIAAVWLISAYLAAQPSAQIQVYASSDPQSLLVVVTVQRIDDTPAVRAPAGIDILLTDTLNKQIDSKPTNEYGEVEFHNLDSKRHPVIRISATSENMIAKAVEIRWRLYMERELKLLPTTPKTKAILRPSYSSTAVCPCLITSADC